MVKPLKKRWVASSYMNSIVFKKITAMDERFPRGTFHDTWAEAHVVVMARCQREFEKAQRELSRATRALAKAKAMQPPPEGTQQ